MTMKRAVALLPSLALVLLAATASAQELAWKEFRSDECRCTASFPGSPQVKSQSMQSSVGNLESKIIMLEVPDAAFYALAYVDYPKDKVATKKPDELLDGARDGAVSKVKGTLKSETRTTQNGFPGRELRIEAPGDLALLARIFLVRERLYQSLVVTKKDRADAPETKKFLSSFQFDSPK